MLHKLVFILTLSLLSSYSYGQDCNLKIAGNLLDKHDNSALDYATLYIVETETGTTSDSNGYFEINNLCAGKYTFIIEHLGCTPDTVNINIAKNTTRNFYLEHHAQELAEITTTASKTEKENTQTITVINNKTLAKLRGFLPDSSSFNFSRYNSIAFG